MAANDFDSILIFHFHKTKKRRMVRPTKGWMDGRTDETKRTCKRVYGGIKPRFVSHHVPLYLFTAYVCHVVQCACYTSQQPGHLLQRRRKVEKSGGSRIGGEARTEGEARDQAGGGVGRELGEPLPRKFLKIHT